MPDKPKASLTWEEPPTRRQRYDWEHIAAQLRQRPYEWATVFERDVTSLATAIRISGVKALLPEKGFEVTTSNNVRYKDEEGKEHRYCTLHLRYNPDKDKD